ncbi:hypothetical protein E1281_38260 [Actinomadura sp. KC345]|uniref:hypothetical protein n=1 Tax=Actinomadura sp. KC345 TaxID=2530371 RepID=UPI00105151B8|nr:hypothetical protein [Actinomadura sp. KC345]TDC40351.1 hypothetical protein E1281_38260 [Actinomadura sp. KC345]
MDQWLETGTVSSVARIRAGNTVLEAEIRAKGRPVVRESDAPIPEREVEDAVAQRFTPPIEDLARRAVASLR